MAYNNAIPQPGDNLSASQAQLLENFAQLDSQYGGTGDHVAFSASSDNGKHKKVTINNVTASSAQTDPQAILHTVKSLSEIFTKYSLPFFNNQAGDLPMLPDLRYTLSGSFENYSFTLGQMIFNFGRRLQQTGVSSYPFTYQKAFPTAVLFRMPMADKVLQKDNSFQIGATVGLSGGTISFSQNTTASANSYVYYFAIGY